MKTYTELCKLKTFKERFEYLNLNGTIGEETFGWDRYLNQVFYTSEEWKKVRRFVLLRDEGCDMGLADYPICDINTPYSEVKAILIVHHMNPITDKDILHREERVLDPEELITVSLATHNAIHYGNFETLIGLEPIERTQGDTKLW